MAIYHFSVSNVARAKGSASTATLSYITGQRVEDERLGEVFYGFGRTERVEMTGVILPDEAPQRFYNPAVMMNEIELYEKSDRARPAKKIEVALPRELTPEQQKDVIESFIRENLAAKGYGAVYAVHDDPEHHNPHCHILLANRQMNAQGWEQTKCRKEYALDEKGDRIPVIDPATGQQKVDSRNRKQWKRVNVEVNPLDQKPFLKELRESWAKECNRFLTPEQQIDHRSNEARGIEAEPTIHEGYAAQQIQQRGGISDRVQINEEIRENNGVLAKIQQLLAAVLSELAELLRQRAKEQEQDRAKNERLVRNVEYIKGWIENTDSLTRMLRHELPDYKGKEDLAAYRAKAQELNRHGWTPEYQALIEQPRFKQLIELENDVKTLINAVEKGLSKGEAPEALVERARKALDGTKDERREKVRPDKERGIGRD